MTKYLVTGGAGFIGSNLVDALVKKGGNVRVFDNLSTGRLENLKSIEDEIDFVQGDVRDLETVRKVMDGVEVVFHEAALPSVVRSVEDPTASHDVNGTGTLNVLISARDAKVRRVIYASSSSVYGDTQELPKREDMPTNPQSPYAVAKLTGEHYCRAFWRVYGLSTVCLRYFNVFGPRQDPDSPYAAVIPKFVRLLKERKPLPVFGDGEQTRDFTYVPCVVQANLQAAERSGIDGEVFNLGSGNPVSLLDLIDLFRQVTAHNPKVLFLPQRPGDVRESWADVGKARRLLALEPIPLKAGLQRLIKASLPEPIRDKLNL